MNKRQLAIATIALSLSLVAGLLVARSDAEGLGGIALAVVAFSVGFCVGSLHK